MARSPINEALRDRRAAALEKLPFEARSARATEGARHAIANYAASHGLTWGEARRRLQALKEAGRSAAARE